jgi:hypothetical protein
VEKLKVKKTTETSAFTKRLVVDCSIAHAAGSAEQALNPTSKNCRDFLLAMRKAKHLLVRTKQLDEEWSRHESSFAKQWRLAMIQNRYVFLVRDAVNSDLRQRISQVDATKNEIAAMLKDALLIEAALPADKAIASLDETSRKLFAISSSSISELAGIVWVNPDQREENPIFWLKQGAWPDKSKQHGSLAKELGEP